MCKDFLKGIEAKEGEDLKPHHAMPTGCYKGVRMELINPSHFHRLVYRRHANTRLKKYIENELPKITKPVYL
jgi:hypothetical protein